MSFKTAKCQLCESPKKVTAEDKHWLIHLAGHKDDIIKFLAVRLDFCPLCNKRHFFSKTQGEDHLRWFHSKRSLIEWYFEEFINKRTSNASHTEKITITQ